MKRDISTHEDVNLLVDTFYGKVRQNKILEHIFTEVAKVDWPHHLPKMYSFWNSMLLNEQSYIGNPMQKHIELSKLTPLTEREFSEWLRLFSESVDELFSGTVANEAKTRATNIAKMMLIKIQAA